MPDINFGYLFIAFLVLLFSLTIHESAHAWTASQLGDPTARIMGRVSLNPAVHVDPIGTILFPLLAMVTRLPLIGWAKPVPVNLRYLKHGRRDYMLVAAAGPASNLALAVAGALALQVIPAATVPAGEMDVSSPLGMIAARTVEINVLLAVFNMVPIPPLDGGNVLAGLLPDRLAQVFDGLRPYGFMIIYALMLTGWLGYLVGPAYFMLLSWLR